MFGSLDQSELCMSGKSKTIHIINWSDSTKTLCGSQRDLAHRIRSDRKLSYSDHRLCSKCIGKYTRAVAQIDFIGDVFRKSFSELAKSNKLWRY